MAPWKLQPFDFQKWIGDNQHQLKPPVGNKKVFEDGAMTVRRSSALGEGLRAGLTSISHGMHLYVVYPALLGFCALFLALGLRNFRRRVLS